MHGDHEVVVATWDISVLQHLIFADSGADLTTYLLQLLLRPEMASP